MERKDKILIVLFFLIIVIMLFSLYYPSISPYFREDDWYHLGFAFKFSPLDYFFKRRCILIQSPVHYTPWNAFFYDINLHIFGIKPVYFYIHQLSILCMSSILIFLLLKSYSSTILAFTGTLLFLAGIPTLHIAHNLMTGHYNYGLLFFISSIISYRNYRIHDNTYMLLVSWLLYVLALTCKEIYAFLPFIILFVVPQSLREHWREGFVFMSTFLLYLLWRKYLFGSFTGSYQFANPNALSILEALKLLISFLTYKLNYFSYLLDCMMFFVLILLLHNLLKARIKRVMGILTALSTSVLPLLFLCKSGVIAPDRTMLLFWLSVVFLFIISLEYIGKFHRYARIFTLIYVLSLTGLSFLVNRYYYWKHGNTLFYFDRVDKTIDVFGSDYCIYIASSSSPYVLGNYYWYAKSENRRNLYGKLCIFDDWNLSNFDYIEKLNNRSFLVYASDLLTDTVRGIMLRHNSSILKYYMWFPAEFHSVRQGEITLSYQEILGRFTNKVLCIPGITFKTSLLKKALKYIYYSRPFEEEPKSKLLMKSLPVKDYWLFWMEEKDTGKVFVLKVTRKDLGNFAKSTGPWKLKNGLSSLPGYSKMETMPEKISLDKAGLCDADRLPDNGKTVGQNTLITAIHGWAFLNETDVPDKVYLALHPIYGDSPAFWVPVKRTFVEGSAELHKNLPRESGWMVGVLDLLHVRPGTYRWVILQKKGDKYYECSLNRTITIRESSDIILN